jgi:aminopeptidase N
VKRLFVFLAACGGSSMPGVDAPEEVHPVDNPARGIADTKLSIDVTTKQATATIAFAPGETGATLEIGDLMIDMVDVEYIQMGNKLVLAVPPTATDVHVAYHYKNHESFQGASMNGYTLDWPYYCGNIFPCHSDPADGTTFTLDLQGVPAGKTAVFPSTIPSEAPSYQLAWSIDDYTELPLGATTAGTQLSIWYRPGQLAMAQQGTQQLVKAFDWFEKTIGPYRFGNKAGTVSTNWGAGQFGGMEHHPFWHVGSSAIGDVETNTHEAAHGWFGDGIRIACWEDFVLSEGTVTYLAGRALDVVEPSVGAAIWQAYANDLGEINPSDKVWPQSCGSIDILKDKLFTRAPYMRGAFFYRAVALKVGADKLDQALAKFYMQNATKPAHMQDMLGTITEVTGYDPTACAQMWLRGSTIPAIGACP